MFAGAFLYALTHGYDHAAAGRLASAAAATTVSHFGPRLNTQQHKDILQKVFG
jgi:fructokinase